MTQTKTLVREITRRLETRGVVVTVQNSITTSSVYLAFDYGVLKQARVGDHKGRGYHYTYEIGDHVQPPFSVSMEYSGRPYTRLRFKSENVGDMIQAVLIARSNMWSKYGKENYANLVAKAKANRK